jgi:hypothetical protein
VISLLTMMRIRPIGKRTKGDRPLPPGIRKGSRQGRGWGNTGTAHGDDGCCRDGSHDDDAPRCPWRVICFVCGYLAPWSGVRGNRC